MKIEQLENHIIRYACLFIGLLFIGSELDNDGWFLLNHGRYVMEQGIPHIEPFTIHENFAFVMQQWLTSAVFWEIYEHFHVAGLLTFLYPISALTIYAVYRLALMTSKGNRDTALVLSSFVGIIICSLFIRTRPQIFSTLIFIGEIIGLEYLRQTNDKKYLLLFPLLSVVLINMHAAMWPMMLVFLLPFCVDYLSCYDKKGYFVKDEKLKPHYLCVIAISIIAAGFVNPYGWDAMTYVFRSYGYDMISNSINEMSPITIRTILGKFCQILFLLVIVIYARHKVAVRHLLITFGTMIMALSSIRSLYLFLAVGLYPLAYIYADWHGLSRKTDAVADWRWRKLLILLINGTFIWIILNRKEQIFNSWNSIGMILFGAVMLAVVLLLVLEWRGGSLRSVQDKFLRCGYTSVIFIVCFLVLVITGNKLAGSKGNADSAQAVAYLLEHENREDVRLWTNYHDGAYAEFQGLRCFIDPRAEVFLSSNNKQRDVFYEYTSLESGKTDYRTFLSWYDFNYILVCEKDIMYTYLPSDENYELVMSYSTDRGLEFCLYRTRL